jgi:hypothetical protein
VRRSTVVCLLWLGACSGAPAAAQIAAPAPPGPYVVDVRGAIAALPQDAAIFPTVPTGTRLPSLVSGIEVGAHVYPIGLGSMRIGIGVSALRVRGTASPATLDSESTSTSSTTSTVATGPDVDATLTTIAPQLSLNFGSAQGWSYLSAGVGRAHLTTGTSAFGGGQSGVAATAAQSLDSGSRTSINVGGGARWFAKAHLAFSFDVRLHLVSASNTEAAVQGAPKMTLLVASVGVGLR